MRVYSHPTYATILCAALGDIPSCLARALVDWVVINSPITEEGVAVAVKALQGDHEYSDMYFRLAAIALASNHGVRPENVTVAVINKIIGTRSGSVEWRRIINAVVEVAANFDGWTA